MGRSDEWRVHRMAVSSGVHRLCRFDGRTFGWGMGCSCRCHLTLAPRIGRFAKGKPAHSFSGSNLPIVSLDEIRGELDVDPTDNQADVVQVARERCREFLRAGTSFAFNATNTVKQTRKRWLDLFAYYKTRTELVYVEPSFDRLFQQNRSTDNPVPEQVITKLASKCEPPTWHECHGLILSDGDI